jgi:hypothetical protein
MEQSERLGNPQERLHDLSWLGGIVDGEGCITVSAKGVKTRKHPYAHPNINITNTDELIVRKVMAVFKKYEIAYYLHVVPKTATTLTKMNLTILGYKRAIRFLKLIIPYLVSKKERALLLLEFVESRLTKGPGIRYSESEKELCRRIWNFNGRGTNHFREESSETLRSAPEKGEDKVQPSEKSNG